MSTEQDKINKAHQAQLAKINHDAEKLAIEREKIKVERENMKNDEKIAKINASNRSNKEKK
jgi:ABC-type phosphate transport system auxiliary subunit